MILIVMEKNLAKYEEKIIEIGRKNTVIDTDFGRCGDVYWMRFECLD